MGISGISAGYYPTGYANNKTTKAVTGVSFANTVRLSVMGWLGIVFASIWIRLRASLKMAEVSPQGPKADFLGR